MKSAVLSLSLLLFCSPAGLADGLHPERVPAQARWVAHVDFSGLFDSHLLAVLAEREGFDLDDEWRDEMVENLGFDPIDEVLGITLFGTTDEPEHGAALVAVSSKVDAALDILATQVHRSVEDVDGLNVTKWESPDGDPPIYSYVARREGSDLRLLVASSVRDEVVTAVSVLRGDADSLASGDGSFPVHTGEGSLAYVAAGDILGLLDGGLDDQALEIRRMVRSIEIEIGEHGDDVFARVSARTANAQAAQQVGTVVQGAKALVTLAAQSEPEAKQALPLLQSIEARTDGDTVTLSFTHDLDGLIELVESMHDRHGGPDLDVHGTLDFTFPGHDGKKDGDAAKAKKKDDGWH